MRVDIFGFAVGFDALVFDKAIVVLRPYRIAQGLVGVLQLDGLEQLRFLRPHGVGCEA